jgi:iron only hydrogenase large subunit-like protein
MASLSPGWVRYAERVLGRPVTPHLCTARSPQQVMGSLVKDYFARQQVSTAFRLGGDDLKLKSRVNSRWRWL